MGELFNQMEFFNKFSDKNDDDILDALRCSSDRGKLRSFPLGELPA